MTYTVERTKMVQR